MESFKYKKSDGITALSASISEYSFKKHAHEEYAIGVTLRGVQEYTLDGKFQSSKQNGVMLFNPGQLHDGNAQDKFGIDYIMLYFDQKHFAEIVAMDDSPSFSSPVVYDHELEKRILNLSSAVMNEKDELYCCELANSLGNYLNPSLINKGRKDCKLAEIVKEMICCDLKNVISLKEISDELNLSKYQLIRTFEASTGISPYQYYLNWKVENAKRIIENTKDIYSAITECNFVDITHLNRHFKKIYGVTAYQYMNCVS